MTKEDKNNIAYVGFEELEPYDPSQPEKELLRAILVTALSDIKKGGDEKRRATEFFLNPEDDYVFSFIAICDYLKIDHNRILTVVGFNNTSQPENGEGMVPVSDEPKPFSDEVLE